MISSPFAAWLTGESATLEFKKSTAELRRTGETLCGFLNGDGGRVLIGVTPAGKAVEPRPPQLHRPNNTSVLELSMKMYA
jgi:predicted HTH transcriptional regulator